MEQLLKKGAGLGLNPSQIEEALCLGRPANDGAWIESQDLLGMAQTVAIENMEEGRFIEYCCLDGRGQPQGRGMVKLMKWEAEDDCLFVGEHGPSSDEYYDWYVNNTGRSGFLFHVCPCQASKCKVKKARGDARELIHVEKWRLLTPKLMVHQKYLEKDGLKYGEDELVKMARDLKGPAPHGTGLDAAHLALAAGAGKDDSGEKGLPSKVDGLMGPSGLDPTERGKKRGREPMGDFLAKQVSKHQANVGPEKKKRKKKKKVKERREGEISLSISSSSSESSGFQAAPVRGGQELWRIAQKKPGHLTRLALDEMNQVPRRQDGRERGGDSMARAEGSSLLEPDLVCDPPTEQGGVENEPRAEHLGDHVGSPVGRSPGSGHRYPDAEAEGSGSLPSGGGMAGEPGDHSTARSFADEGGRKRSGHQERIEVLETEGGSPEDAEGKQIGVGQRVRPRRETREPTRKRKAEERRRESSPRSREKRSIPSEGAVRRSQDPPASRRSFSKEECSSPQASGSGPPKGDKPRSSSKVKQSQQPRKRTSQGKRKGEEGEVEVKLEEVEKERKEKRRRLGDDGDQERPRPRREGSSEGRAEVDGGIAGSLPAWLSGETICGLSSAQVASHIILQMTERGTSFGKLLLSSLEPSCPRGMKVKGFVMSYHCHFGQMWPMRFSGS